MPEKIYTKPPFTIKEQIDKLISRGLKISNQDKAEHHLKFISYYRFAGYCLAFENENSTNNQGSHIFKPGTTFEQIYSCYLFDSKLRLLTLTALEHIEIGIRTVMINELAFRHGGHWYTKKNLFIPAFNHDLFIEKIKKDLPNKNKLKDAQLNNKPLSKKHEPFLEHYFLNYDEPELPPIWMIAEIISLGTWSKLFGNLADRDDQKIICSHFSINHMIMSSWLHSLAYLRNLCAHHCRIWNRQFTIKPATIKKYKEHFVKNNRFSAYAAIINIILKIIEPDSKWVRNLEQLFKEFPDIKLEKLGFNTNCFKDLLR